MTKNDRKNRHPHIRGWFFIALLVLILGLSYGCGCLLPDIPCVPGVRQDLCKGFRK